MIDLVKQVDDELERLGREVAKLEHVRAILVEDKDNEVFFKSSDSLKPAEVRERVVDFLRRQGQAPRVEVLEATGVSRDGLNQALDQLEADGLVRREENQGSGGVTVVWTGAKEGGDGNGQAVNQRAAA